MTRLVVFNLSGINKIFLSSNTFKHSRLRNLIIWSRCPVVRHNNIASLCDTTLGSQFTNTCWFLRYWKTLLAFPVVTYRGKAGLILKAPLKNLLTKGSFPKGMPWSGFIREDNWNIRLKTLCLFQWLHKGDLPVIYDKSQQTVWCIHCNVSLSPVSMKLFWSQ